MAGGPGFRVSQRETVQEGSPGVGVKCPSASLCLYRKLPLPSATGSRGSMARKWLRISLFTSVRARLCWQVAAASNNAFSSACLWGCVHTHTVSAARCTDPQFQESYTSDQPVGNLQELAFREKKTQKICNNIGNWVGGRGGRSAACCRRAACHPACCDLWHEECMGWRGRARCPAAIPGCPCVELQPPGITRRISSGAVSEKSLAAARCHCPTCHPCSSG